MIASGGKEMSNRIRETRKKKKMTLDQLSEASKVSRSTISRYETSFEKTSPSLPAMEKIANALGVSVSYLQGTTDDPTKPGEATSYQKAIIEYLWWACVDWDGWSVSNPIVDFASVVGVDVSDLIKIRNATYEKKATIDPENDEAPDAFPMQFKKFSDGMLPHIAGIEAALRAQRLDEVDIRNATQFAYNMSNDDVGPDAADKAVGQTISEYIRNTVRTAEEEQLELEHPEIARLEKQTTEAYIKYVSARYDVYEVIKQNEFITADLASRYKNARNKFVSSIDEVDALVNKNLKR